MDKLHKLYVPVTVCMVCRKPGPPGQTVAAVNRGCATVYSEAGKQKRCRGIMRAAIGEHDWAECPGCDATGRETTTSKRCSICDGRGWIFARSFQPLAAVSPLKYRNGSPRLRFSQRPVRN